MLYNSALYVSSSGDIQNYRKSYLYGDYEKRYFTAAIPTTDLVSLNGVKLGALICYDVEFPENVRRLALAGADLVVVPTALPAGQFSNFIAGNLVKTRAFENQIFLAYVNHCGNDGVFEYAGQSIVVAPDGHALASASQDGEHLLFSDLKLDAYEQSRAQNSYLRDLVAS